MNTMYHVSVLMHYHFKRNAKLFLTMTREQYENKLITNFMKFL